MTNAIHYDAVILGGGKAGKTLAMDFAKSGLKVAMVENGMIGGTCINVACIPTKTMVASAKIAHTVQHASSYGISCQFNAVDFAKVIERKRNVVDQMKKANLDAFLKSGMDLILGKGHFVGPKTIEVNLIEPREGKTQIQLTAEKIFINTGALPFVPPIPGLKEVGYLTNDTLMELQELPKHLMIMGGGYIGLEFGQMFRRFGSEVTIIEKSPVFIPLEDRDIAEEVKNLLEAEGIKILLNYEVVRAESAAQQKILVLKNENQQEVKIEGDQILAAVGRIPNTASLNLQACGVKTNERGFIEVNEYLETNVPGIWAMGDVKGGAQFTHLSWDDYRIVKQNMLRKSHVRSIKNRLIPYTVFIDPELARIGLTEQEAIKQGYQIKVAKLPVANIPRAKTLGETKGVMKVIINAEDDLILGAAIFGPEGGEVMSSIQVAMMGGLPYTALRDAMFAHPTLVEGLNILFDTVK